jgi:23S rRNA pseudouridine1911/1915/1917 synthase
MLRRVLPDRTDPQLRSLISRRQVQIDGNVCTDAHRKLRSDQIIRIYTSPRARPIEASDLNIRFQDEHLLVVEKPPGITAVREADEQGKRDKQPTLDELLQQRLDREGLLRLPGRGAATASEARKNRRKLSHQLHQKRLRIRVRPVHRLDRDTSGLMIFALSDTAEAKLKDLFAQHAIDRAYLAVVQGVIRSQTVRTHFVRDRGDGLRGSVQDPEKHPDAKPAITHIKFIRSIRSEYSMIECKLETGRTHQIRIHLSEIGHPLCGEKLYVRLRPGAEPVTDRSSAPRQALHAYRLSFVHPITGQSHTFESKWPRDLHKWLKKLEESNDSTPTDG